VRHRSEIHTTLYSAPSEVRCTIGKLAYDCEYAPAIRVVSLTITGFETGELMSLHNEFAMRKAFRSASVIFNPGNLTRVVVVAPDPWIDIR
jgi:hypothetical protein